MKPADIEAEHPIGSSHPTSPPAEDIGWVEPTDIEAGNPVDSSHTASPPLEPLEIEAVEASPLDDESSYSVGAISEHEVISSLRQPTVARPRIRAPWADKSPDAPVRPMDRGARRRKPPRRSRRELEAPDSAGDDRISAPVFGADLPSVQDILATHRNSPGPRPAVERSRPRKAAVPTVPQEPGQWVLPGWLALPSVGIATLGIGLIASVLSWWWAIDASNASFVTQRLLAADGSGRRRRLPEGFHPPGGRWIKTTAQHLAHWAIFTARVEQDGDRRATEARSILTQSLEVSPLNPTARLAMSQLEGAGGDGPGRIRGLGLSRDSVSLAWSARRLMDSGKKEASLRLYHRALSAAVDGGLSRSVTPRFADDATTRRFFYLLPSEDAVRDIVAELAAREGLAFREWSRALPRNPTVLLATARLLREQGIDEADALLDQILRDDWGATEQGQVDPRLLAARGEALILRSRWPEAAEQYRQAIDRVDNELIRRSWWFNLADIAQRLNDEGQRQAALRAALAVNSSDDISRRVGVLQRSADAKVRPRPAYGTARAN
jgi:tetratricopeptide (TPR) repeat protein